MLNFGGLNSFGSGASSFSGTITSTVGSGGAAMFIQSGAQIQFGIPANYLSEGGNVLTYGGNNGFAAQIFRGYSGTPMVLSATGQVFIYSSDADGHIVMLPNLSAANGGATALAAAVKAQPANALDATDYVFSVANNTPTNLFAVAFNGSIQLPSTDSTGTPGNATINQATGRSSIAAAASSCVITNSLVTAASHVFISPRTRDATGLLPLVTTIGAGSFTVTTTAGCTANLVFDWFVVT